MGELVYLASLLNTQGLMSSGPGAGQCDERWQCPRLEYTGFRIRDPVVWNIPLLLISKIQVFLRSFYTVRYIDGAKRWLYAWEVLCCLTLIRKLMTQTTALVAKEARALRARSHGSGKPVWHYHNSSHTDITRAGISEMRHNSPDVWDTFSYVWTLIYIDVEMRTS